LPASFYELDVSSCLSIKCFVYHFNFFLPLLINFQADILDVKYKATIDDLENVKMELHNVNREKQSVEKKCSHVSLIQQCKH
jgi:hypothetical protein